MTGNDCTAHGGERGGLSPQSRSDWPTYVVGCHRSGTTLLRYLLDAHPNIACTPETKFLGGLNAFVNYPQGLEGLSSIGVPEREVMYGLRQLVSGWMTAYARGLGKRRWVDKTPNYIRILPLIDSLFAAQVLFIGVVRCPFDTVDSLYAAPYFAPSRLTDPDIAPFVRTHGWCKDAFAHYWADVNRRLYRFALASGTRLMLLKYEDLVHQPVETLTSVLSFIGEEYSEGMLERAFAEPHMDGFGDWKIRNTRRVHKSSVRRGANWTAEDRHRIWDIVQTAAVNLGYKARLRDSIHPCDTQPSA